MTPYSSLARLWTAGAIVMASGASGCMGLPRCTTEDTQFVIVERRTADSAGYGGKPEVTETPAYKALHGGFRTVALRLPDNCYQAEMTKGQNYDAAQLESSCGIPLQVLESTLTQEGYQVLSWSTLMGIEHNQSVPVHIAAQQIGADFVVIVNDMYVGLEPTGSEANAAYRYLVSDPEGNSQGPAPLFQGDRDVLKKFVRDRAGNDPQANLGHSLLARLNATIVLARGGGDAPTAAPVAAPPGRPGAPAPAPVAPAAPRDATQGRSGEAIWFYNWRVGDLDHNASGMRSLFGGIPIAEYARRQQENQGQPVDDRDPNRHFWWPVLAKSGDIAPALPRDQAVSEERFSSKAEISPEEKAVLYRRIARDFIQRFKGV